MSIRQQFSTFIVTGTWGFFPEGSDFLFLGGKARLSWSPVCLAHPKRLPSREWRRDPHGRERKKSEGEGTQRDGISLSLSLTSKKVAPRLRK